MRVPALLRGYFADMSAVLKECRRLVKKNGHCYCVVGNSAYAGIIVPTDVLIALIGQAAGFRSAEIQVVRHLTVAPQQRNELLGLERFMRESVVVFS
jgi:site-specific DNA-methyltransferase (adenine-specific)